MTRRFLIRTGLGFVVVCLLVIGFLLWRFATPTMVLQDMVAAGGSSLIKDMTDAPVRSTGFVPMPGESLAVDTYVDRNGYRGHLILVPGFSPAGKDDGRLMALAKTFARAGFAVHVPDLPGSRSLMVSEVDVEGLIATIEARAGDADDDTPVGIAAVSYAAGPAVVAAIDPRVADRVDYVVALGGYHDAESVITYLTTGAYRQTGETDWQYGAGNLRAGWVFMAANAARWHDPAEGELLQEAARLRAEDPDIDLSNLRAYLGSDAVALMDLFENRDPDRSGALLRALPPSILTSLTALSPSRHDLESLGGKLILVHGLDDQIVPFTESLNLQASVPQTDLFLVSSFTHVDPDNVDWWGYVTMMLAVDTILDRGLGARQDL